MKWSVYLESVQTVDFLGSRNCGVRSLRTSRTDEVSGLDVITNTLAG